jgi:hypothetical protein
MDIWGVSQSIMGLGGNVATQHFAFEGGHRAVAKISALPVLD